MTFTAKELLMLFQGLPQTGPAAYWRLMEHFDDLHSALAAPVPVLKTLLSVEAVNQWLEILREGEAHASVQRVRNELDWLAARNIEVLTSQSTDYPVLLRELKRAPPLLYVWGDPAILSLPQIAVVGSRKPTSSGRNNAHNFAKDLASAGFVVTSGLALGVDVIAHQGALAGEGKTLAVLGTGIDQIYPAKHVTIAEQIVAEGGAVISEFPIGTGALASNFPQRNRIISGLSCGVLVVEAAVKSGSLITARYALEQNREVFAIPGSIQNELSRGCHALIKDGAALVESASEIIVHLESILAFKRDELRALQQREPEFTAEASFVDVAEGLERTLLQAIGFETLGFDQLAEVSGAPTGDLMAALLTMELKGWVVNSQDGYSVKYR